MKKIIALPLYWPRFIDHYGHFMRDRILYLFYFLENKGYLDNPDVEIHYGNRTLKHFPRNHSRYGRWSRMPDTFSTFMTDVFGATHHGPKQWSNFVKIAKEPNVVWCDWPRWRMNPTRDAWGGASAYYPKISINKFRDYCFKKYNFTPELQRRVLYVPRKDYSSRYIDDDLLESELKQWCNKNNYQFLKWHNERTDSIFDQMQIYAESKIIVGLTGSDFINSYWTSEDNLMVEICLPKFHSGLSASFYIDEETCYCDNCKWCREVPTQPAEKERQRKNWKHIKISKESIQEVKLGQKVSTNQEERNKIIKILNEELIIEI